MHPILLIILNEKCLHCLNCKKKTIKTFLQHLASPCANINLQTLADIRAIWLFILNLQLMLHCRKLCLLIKSSSSKEIIHNKD